MAAVPQGTWTTFVRLAGCNLNCSYCDSKKSIDSKNGTFWNEKALAKKIIEMGNDHVLFTGGEPLCQSGSVRMLLHFFEEFGYRPNTTIETNGTILDSVFTFINCVVFDYKINDSHHMMPIKDFIRHGDVLKIVIDKKQDIQKAIDFFKEVRKRLYFGFLAVSPTENIDPALLLDVISKHKELGIVYNAQIHKYIGVQ